MATPVANFTFQAIGLSVQFTDRSSGIVTSYLWDFGFKISTVEQTSTLQNPPPVIFPAAGTYMVSLAVTNSDGTNTFTFPIIVSTSPNFNIDILAMVQYDLPVGIALDNIGFEQSIIKWQLWLQGAAEIADADVFNQLKWPPIYNVLIAKLIEYDLILRAATASMASYMSAAESFNTLSSQITTETMQVADYTLPGVITYPVVVNLIESNGKSAGPSDSLADAPSLLTYLNGLGFGVFAIDGTNHLVSLGNNQILTTFNYTIATIGTNSAFVQSNARIVPLNFTVGASSGGSLFKGAMKSLKTGPSEAQWYDGSLFWTNLFKDLASGANGQGGGLIGAIMEEICFFSSKLGVSMPMCPKLGRVVVPFIIAKRCIPGCHGIIDSSFPPWVISKASRWPLIFW